MINTKVCERCWEGELGYVKMYDGTRKFLCNMIQDKLMSPPNAVLVFPENVEPVYLDDLSDPPDNCPYILEQTMSNQ